MQVMSHYITLRKEYFHARLRIKGLCGLRIPRAVCYRGDRLRAMVLWPRMRKTHLGFVSDWIFYRVHMAYDTYSIYRSIPVAVSLAACDDRGFIVDSHMYVLQYVHTVHEYIFYDRSTYDTIILEQRLRPYTFSFPHALSHKIKLTKRITQS